MKKPCYQSEFRLVEDFAEFGMEKVPFSGALVSEKLDGSSELLGMRVSNKHTFAESFTIRLEDWLKDEKQAKFMGMKLFRRVECENKQTGKLEKFIVLKQDLFISLLSSIF